MSEMGDWINQMFATGAIRRPESEWIAEKPMFNRPGGEGPLPELGAPPTEPPDIGAPPTAPPGEGGAPAYPGAPPWATDPGVPAPLADFLRWYQSGYGTGITQEMYDYFGGDAMLTALQQFDPTARWVDTDLGGGEGGMSTRGRRLEYNQGALPAGVGPGWQMPVSLHSDRLRNSEMQYYDPVYGWVTDPRNVYHKSEGIEKWAPAIAALISAGGPALGAAAAGAGIGAGAGGTAAVTGGAAGLAPSNIALGGTPSWWTNWLGKAPRTVGPYLSGAPSTPSGNPGFRPPVRPPIARNQALPDPYGFDPASFNAGGSAPKTRSNDSKLVATDFADDPYRFS